MKILITGASGFSGTALIRHLIDQGERDICGIARGALPAPLLKAGIRSVQCDLLDASRIRKVMENINPDHIIHLAALNRGTLAELLKANAVGTRNLLDAVDAANPACQTLIVSSSAVYGYPGRDPIGEGTPLLPLSDYGVSKAAQEHVALMHHAITGGPIAIARPFNLIGPGQPDSLICGRIVRQVVEIEQGQRKHLELQETRSYRDFIDVRDTVRAYRALVSHADFEHMCSGKAFNIGSGTATPVSQIITHIEEITGKQYVVALPENPPLIPLPYQQGDISSIGKTTGWKPEISLKNSLMDMLAVCRADKTI